MSHSFALAVVSGSSLAMASSAHCALMCGPLAMASTRRRGGQKGRYFVGRLVSYTLLGALSGSAGRAALAFLPARYLETAVSWSLAVTLCVAALPHLRGIRQPGAAAEPALIALKRAPTRRPFNAFLARMAQDPLLLGVATALLPCGVLYAALTGAAGLADPLPGALMMGSFAVVSGLSLLGLASLAERLGSLGQTARRALGAALLVGACLLFLRPIPLLRSGDAGAACVHCAHAAGGAP